MLFSVWRQFPKRNKRAVLEQLIAERKYKTSHFILLLVPAIKCAFRRDPAFKDFFRISPVVKYDNFVVLSNVYGCINLLFEASFYLLEGTVDPEYQCNDTGTNVTLMEFMGCLGFC
jgi:hypothetical protein